MQGDHRQTLSVCIITLNEEINIERCLKSVSYADEIIVVDSFSKDRTVEVAGSLGAKVYQREWPGFVDQKNFALDKTTCDWVLSLDADEESSEDLKQDIERILQGQENVCYGYYIPRRVFYLGKWISHCGWYPDYVLRVFKRGMGKWSGNSVHEQIVLTGQTGRLSGSLLHYPYRTIREHLDTINLYSSLSAQDMHTKGRLPHWKDILLHPLARFIKMYFLRLGFLDGITGLIISALGAFYVLSKYAKLYEITQTESKTY